MIYKQFYKRGTTKEEQCCASVDLKCFGCSPIHLAKGIECKDQTFAMSLHNAPVHDCFCDLSCIQFEDCCHDHEETCAHLYQEVPTQSTTNSTPTSKPGISSTSPPVSSCEYIQEGDKLKFSGFFLSIKA